MSWVPCNEAVEKEKCPASIEMVIVPRTGDIGNFEVRRALPFHRKRMVGPFIFWDQMGPGEFLTGQGVDVRPHPHIGLSTVTYLFDGSMDHKDSLGNDMRIVPGDVNLMTAGSGIVHSERTGLDVRNNPSKLFGIQSWLAQPKSYEEGSPAFDHTSDADLPDFDDGGMSGRIILGEFGGLHSPVKTQWDTAYIEFHLKAGEGMAVPKSIEERAIYAISGEVEIDGHVFEPQQMLVLKPGEDIDIKATTNLHFMLLGGAAMDGSRYMYWNFVSSSNERLEQAKEDWREQRFAKVPGDETEFIPLPD
jgi:redox-sensitive bicupin YhaK (pirin superfamily)